MFYILGEVENFTAYKGKVSSMEKYVTTSVKGTTTHPVVTGSDCNVRSSSDLTIKKKYFCPRDDLKNLRQIALKYRREVRQSL